MIKPKKLMRLDKKKAHSRPRPVRAGRDRHQDAKAGRPSSEERWTQAQWRGPFELLRSLWRGDTATSDAVGGGSQHLLTRADVAKREWERMDATTRALLGERGLDKERFVTQHAIRQKSQRAHHVA